MNNTKQQAPLELNAQIDAIKLGGIPGGTRLDLRYLEVPPTKTSPAAFTFRYTGGELTGKVVTGHDWALVRDDDGVVIFDGRITILLQSSMKRLSVIARINGRTTLTRARMPDGSVEQQPELALNQWRNGFESGTTLPLEVVMQFTADISRGSPAGLIDLENKLYFGFGIYTFDASADRIHIKAFDAASLRPREAS